MSSFVRVVRAHAEETVEIQWRISEHEVYIQRVTIPPRASREAQQLAQEQVQAERRQALGHADREPGR